MPSGGSDWHGAADGPRTIGMMQVPAEWLTRQDERARGAAAVRRPPDGAPMRLAGRVALVTGAGRRVGRAIAVALGARGMRVVVHYNGSREGADETVRIDRAGGRQRDRRCRPISRDADATRRD